MMLLAIAAALLLSACLPYPVYKALQPDALVTVLDSANEPQRDAEVSLIANTYPYGREHSRRVRMSGADGKPAFSAIREWRTEVLMIHGAEYFFWNWCIRKAGYATYATTNSSTVTFQAEPVVRLEPGPSTECRQAHGQ